MIENISCCPDCGWILHYMDGSIDPEWNSPDFFYCSNPDCDNTNGYDPSDFVEGIHTIVVSVGSTQGG